MMRERGRRSRAGDGGRGSGTEVEGRGRRSRGGDGGSVFRSLNWKTLTWIFDQRARLRQAAPRRRRPRIHRERLAEVTYRGLRIAGVEAEEADVYVSRWIARVGGERCGESRARALD